jgi:hypothetical protein
MLMGMWNGTVTGTTLPVFDITEAQKLELQRVYEEVKKAPPTPEMQEMLDRYSPTYREWRHDTSSPCLFDNLDPRKAYGIACPCPKHSTTC